MIGDPFLNYFALGLLIFVVFVIFYGIIAIHDMNCKKESNSPTAETLAISLAARCRGNRTPKISHSAL